MHVSWWAPSRRRVRRWNGGAGGAPFASAMEPAFRGAPIGVLHVNTARARAADPHALAALRNAAYGAIASVYLSLVAALESSPGSTS